MGSNYNSGIVQSRRRTLIKSENNYKTLQPLLGSGRVFLTWVNLLVPGVH